MQHAMTYNTHLLTMSMLEKSNANKLIGGGGRGEYFQNKWIFHPGKVSCVVPFREEFSYFLIHACCRKL